MEVKGQILWSGTMTVKISNPERYMMQSLYCEACSLREGFYNIYFHPNGLSFTCQSCGYKNEAIPVSQHQPGQPDLEDSKP